MPEFLHKLIKTESTEYIPISECRILAVRPQIAVPQPCASVFRIDFLASEETSVKWLGEIPARRKFYYFRYNFSYMAIW